MAGRVAALAALEKVVVAAMETALIAFQRDPEDRVAAGAVCIMRDGVQGQPETLLSPLRFIWEHQVEFEIAASGEDRAETVERIIALFEPALAGDRTLGGAVEDARIMQPPLISEAAVNDAETERFALLDVQLVYTTDSAAG